MGPSYPHFCSHFHRNYQIQMGCIKARKTSKNKQKSIIPLYTRETRHDLDFSTKKNIQLIEKVCSKNRLIRRLWWHKCHKQPSSRTYKENPQNEQKSSFFCKFGQFWPKISKFGTNRNEIWLKKRVFWRFCRQTRGVPRETRKRVPAR